MERVNYPMKTLTRLPSRLPVVADRQTPLSEEQHGIQINRGLFTVERGESLAIPVDRLSEPTTFLNRKMWRQGTEGVYRPGVRMKPYGSDLQRKVLIFLRDKIDTRIPYWYYLTVLGHDIHISTRGDLYARHWHRGWADPFTGNMVGPIDLTLTGQSKETQKARMSLIGRTGFVEQLGWLSGSKVTDAFVSEVIDELVSGTGSEFDDFDYAEVGTSSSSENNNQTSLVTSSGISRVSGTPSDIDPIYQSVATITADVTETWQEHGLFNNSSGAAMMDRSLTGGQSVNAADQVEYTYQLTENAEA